MSSKDIPYYLLSIINYCVTKLLPIPEYPNYHISESPKYFIMTVVCKEAVGHTSQCVFQMHLAQSEQDTQNGSLREHMSQLSEFSVLSWQSKRTQETHLLAHIQIQADSVLHSWQ